MNKKLISSLVVIIALILGIYFIYFNNKNIPIDEKTDDSTVTTDLSKTSVLVDGRQCYTYDHQGTDAEPYTVREFIDININAGVVTGNKSGTQSGPDMTNGYNGTLTGQVSGDRINVVFAYTVEGSKNKEEELYQARADKIGIEKLRYPLIDQGGILVPDTTKEYKTLLYARVGCEAAN